MLQEFFRVTADFVEDDSNYGIYCETEDEKEKFEILSLTEYKTQRALGNVKINPRYKHPPFTDEEMKEMKEVFTDIDIEHMALMRKQPFVRRLIKNPETLKSSPAIESKRGEIARLVANMSEEQLDGVLVMLKEVIPKIK